jgi:transposase
LTDPGFDFSLLSEFRHRLLAAGQEEVLLKTLLQVCRERGWLKERGKQHTDSTHVLAAIRTMNRLECVAETLRAALNSLAVVVPDWLRAQVPLEWYDRYGTRTEAYRFPKEARKRQTLSEQIGSDGWRLLLAIRSANTPAWVSEVPAVEILRRVWVHQFWMEEGVMRWRSDTDSPPASILISSPYDPEAHLRIKRSTVWTGYVDGEHRVSSQDTYGVELLGPVTTSPSWQSHAGQGFDHAGFTIDWQAKKATCPQGKISRKWTLKQDGHASEVIRIQFGKQDSLACPCRSQCTTALTNPRQLLVRPQAQFEAIQAARHRQQTQEFKERYAIRAGIEGTISQGVRAFDLRRSRSIGQAKTHVQHIIIATAINLSRLLAWLRGIPLDGTRISCFAALAL